MLTLPPGQMMMPPDAALADAAAPEPVTVIAGDDVAGLLRALASRPDQPGLWQRLLDLAEAGEGLDPAEETALGRIPACATPEGALTRARLLLALGHRVAGTGLLRGIPALAADRDGLVRWTQRAAAYDPDFLGYVGTADRRRDQLSWAEAEYQYFIALQLYPSHSGYVTQYAHCLKEQDKLLDAELCYRSALALGEAPADLWQHIEFVCARQGYRAERPAPPADAPAAAALHLAPTRQEIASLFELLLGRAPWSNAEVIEVMRRCPRLADVVALLFEQQEFQVTHRSLLEIIASR
jgi:hypothetical protein